MNQNAQFVDWLFAQLPGEGQAYSTPLAFGAALGIAGTPLPAGQETEGRSGLLWPSPPPPLKGPEDLQAAYEWLKNERGRLEAYTRSQFETIRRQNQAIMEKHFRSEEVLAVRSQELNREMQFLATQTEALRRQSSDLAERERALAAQVEKLSQAQEDLIATQQANQSLQDNVSRQRSVLENLRRETAELQSFDASEHAKLDSLETVLRQRQQEWEQKQRELTARQGEMEKRFSALQKDESAVERRMRELDEWESRLRDELEQWERELILERRDLDKLRTELGRARPSPAPATLTARRLSRLRELDELGQRGGASGTDRPLAARLRDGSSRAG